jgi:DNA-directed RNA polymerase specialized sigma24 family protein
MDRRARRSTGVTDTLTVSLPTRSDRAGFDFEALYRSSRDDLYAYVAALLRDRSAAEDVTALAFERAYRRRRLFYRRRGSERAWLFGIARNAALDELRRSAVRAALAALEPRDRELIALKFFAELSNAELARVLRVSESNAGTLLHRAVQKLRKACHENP